MKNASVKGLTTTTCPDGSPRRVVGAALYGKAGSKNAATTLQPAAGRFGAPAAIPSDDGPRFVGSGMRRKPSGSWTPTTFGAELLVVYLNNSRTYHSHTAGKPKRFHKGVED